uniref:THAP-type domain-containing protein n=1 Tax=Sander lucioperca TaxID=283035 RepID=A0A8C9XIX9_SANLU
MVKCVVSGCPNRMVPVAGNRGVFNRPPKRFFRFPADPARVQVWLAALRETDRQDATELHLICEDHFLQEDVSTEGVQRDAIPIMPPYLDGPLGPARPWGAESSEEEEGGATADCQDQEEEESDPQDTPLQSSLTTFNVFSVSCADVSLGQLTLRFLELLLAAPDGALDLRDAAESLQTCKRRVYDITHVLTGINLVQKESTHWVKWIGKSPISSFLPRFQSDLENLKQTEEQLDGLIRRCALQLFHLTDDSANSWSLTFSTAAYVTYQDVSRLWRAQRQTLVVVRAPEETKLDIPAPQEGSIQVHLKAERGPITVLTCETETGNAATSDSGQKSGVFFLPLEESRVRTSTLHTVSSAIS